MDAAEPLLGAVADLVRGMAEHLLPAVGEEDPVAAEIPVPQPVIGTGGGERVALLALAQCGSGPVALGDVAVGHQQAALQPLQPHLERPAAAVLRSEEHTSELQSLMRISY